MSILTTAATAFAVLFLLMCVIWLWFRRINNAAVVDVGWGNGFAIAALIAFLMLPGWFERKLLMALMVIFWGERLTLHLVVDRVLGGKPEDGRYQKMREEWKTNISSKFFVFFQFQTLLVVILAVPFYLVMADETPGFSPLVIAGVGVWLIGLIGESIADAQLRRFKSRPESTGRTCRDGLWKYTRHPNYFFEWLVWVGYGLMALGSPWGWLGLIAPVAMYIILTRVTGIPLTEEQALRSRGDDYRAYQKTTSAFVPWFPRREQA